MARQQATVGTEERLRQELRDYIAARIGSGDHEPFVLDLMELDIYVSLTDESRDSMRKIINGYSGASTTWNGVMLPVYRYDVLEQSHRVRVSYS